MGKQAGRVCVAREEDCGWLSERDTGGETYGFGTGLELLRLLRSAQTVVLEVVVGFGVHLYEERVRSRAVGYPSGLARENEPA